MTYATLATRRLLRSLCFVLSVALLFGVAVFGVWLDDADRGLQAGYYTPSQGPLTTALRQGLEGYGCFISFDSEQALRTAVSAGEVNCGLLFASDLEQRLQQPSLSGSVLLLHCATTTLPDFYREVAVAELLTVAAPYFSRPVLDRLEVGRDLTPDVVAAYEALQKEGNGFFFEVQSVQGDAPPISSFGVTWTVTVLSVLLFAIPLLQACRMYQRSYQELSHRIGRRAALRTVFLPEALIVLAAECVCLVVATPLSVAWSGQTQLWSYLPACLISAVLLFAVATALALLLQRVEWLQMLLIPTLLLTLVLCPLYVDYGLFFPLLRTARLFLPTYWVFCMRDCEAVWGIATVAALAGVIAWLWFAPRRSGIYE